jgi:hypothetical protein
MEGKPIMGPVMTVLVTRRHLTKAINAIQRVGTLKKAVLIGGGIYEVIGHFSSTDKMASCYDALRQSGILSD